MTVSSEAAEHPLNVPEDLLEELTAIYHSTFDTDVIEERLREVGYRPPDEREGWSIAYAYGRDGEDIGLVWSEPSFPID